MFEIAGWFLRIQFDSGIKLPKFVRSWKKLSLIVRMRDVVGIKRDPSFHSRRSK